MRAEVFRFAPHLGLFQPGPGLFHHTAGLDPVDQISFIADQGFTAVQDNFLRLREHRVQERIGAALAQRGMTMGSFVATLAFDRPTYGSDDPSAVEFLRQSMRESLDAAKRVNSKWLTTIPGLQLTAVAIDRQRETAISNLRRCAEEAEKAGAVLLLEALNKIDRPGMLFSKIVEAGEIVRAVDSAACRLVFDVYHVQVESGDLIRNIDRCWTEIGYFQIGDNPGRFEPGTGEINFGRVLSHIHNRGYRGLIDMEHKLKVDSAAGEMAMLEAYRRLEHDAKVFLTPSTQE
jgi:hydroxypyruvate isomerase